MKFKKKIGINHITCIKCGYVYDTQLGNFDTEEEALNLAEKLHKDQKKCKKSNLIVELVDLRYEIK